ncbi:MAG: hypothetical protein Q4G28_00955 [Neisseria sp.]|nr:hypothetical protein [Neisseria sp.]
MRTCLLVIAAALLGGIYYLQSHPEIGVKIRQTFSRENMLEPKFRREEDREKYQKQKAPLFPTVQPQPKSSAACAAVAVVCHKAV